VWLNFGGIATIWRGLCHPPSVEPPPRRKSWPCVSTSAIARIQGVAASVCVSACVCVCVCVVTLAWLLPGTDAVPEPLDIVVVTSPAYDQGVQTAALSYTAGLLLWRVTALATTPTDRDRPGVNRLDERTFPPAHFPLEHSPLQFRTPRTFLSPTSWRSAAISAHYAPRPRMLHNVT